MNTNTPADPRPLGRRRLLPAMFGALLLAAGPATAAPPPGRSPERIELAMQAGLRHILRNQRVDGSFVCEKYPVAVTGLACLALMANRGEAPEPAYDQAIRAGIDYLLAAQPAAGFSGANFYEHSMGALAVLHWLGMGAADDDPRLAEHARRAVAVAVEAARVSKPPRSRGGWSYMPNARDSDLSNTSWAVMMLFAARQCGFDVDADVLPGALGYVRRCAQGEGYGYTPAFTTASARAHRSLTGVAIFLQEILEPGSMAREPEVVRWLTEVPPSWGGSQYRGYFFCSGFYITQGLFQLGGELWNDYFDRLVEVLLAHQASDGHWPFPPDNLAEGRRAGTVYSTAMAVLMLSLEKQHLPIYQRQAPILYRDE